MAPRRQLSAIIESSEPHFINVQFDIKVTSARDRFRSVLRSLGFVMDTYSVYYGKFSQQLLDEIEKHKRRYGSDRIKIRLPAYSNTDYIQYLKDYEQAFLAQFDELQMLLDRVDRCLIEDELKKEKHQVVVRRAGKDVTETRERERPFTAREIMSQIRHAENIMSDLEAALAKRIAVEQKEFKEKPEKYTSIERTLRHQSSHLMKQRESCKRRALREGGQLPL